MKRLKQKTEVLDDAIIPEPLIMRGHKEAFLSIWKGWVKGDTTAVVGTLQIDDDIPMQEAREGFEEWIATLQKSNHRQLEWRGGPTTMHGRKNKWYFHVVIKGLEPANLKRAESTWTLDFGRAYLEQLGPEWTGLESHDAWSEYGNRSGYE